MSILNEGACVDLQSTAEKAKRGGVKKTRVRYLTSFGDQEPPDWLVLLDKGYSDVLVLVFAVFVRAADDVGTVILNRGTCACDRVDIGCVGKDDERLDTVVFRCNVNLTE